MPLQPTAAVWRSARASMPLAESREGARDVMKPSRKTCHESESFFLRREEQKRVMPFCISRKGVFLCNQTSVYNANVLDDNN